MMPSRVLERGLVRSFGQQVAISALATLGATGVLTGIRSELRVFLPPTAPHAAAPSLMSGGKFSMRAIAEGDTGGVFALPGNDSSAIPMFLVPGIPALYAAGPADPTLATGFDTVGPSLVDAQRDKGTSPQHTRRHIEVSSLAPSRRRSAARVIAMTALPDLPVEVVSRSIWDRPRAIYTQLASWGDDVVDRLMTW